MNRFASALVLAALSTATSARAAPKQIRATRVDRAPTIDGRLDDDAWQRAEFVTDFAQRDPHEGAEPSRRTEVAFVYDGDALYIGARMHADGPDDVQAVMTRRDDSGNAERIIVSFDTFGDQRTAYSFAVTAAGVRVDWYHPDDNAFSRDASFDPVWDANAHVGADGWTAEMRIPFSQLRFPARDAHTWGVNINRYMPQDREDVFWIVVPRDDTGWSSYFGALEGIEDIEPSARLELLPYVAADATVTSDALIAEGDPFTETLALDARVGGDLKLGLGPSLTLDATVNPDFGQVEADPAVVNLSAFEVSFAERRPFFTEGAELLRGIGPQYFYSRRIGAPPHGAAIGDFSDVPRFTPILGAAKVTGRIDRTAIGALGALTSNAHADVSIDGMTDELRVEPYTGFGVLRLQRELGSQGSIAGASFTSTYRHMNDGDPLADQLARQAYAGGVDGRWRFDDAGYELVGFVGGSVVQGEAAAIERIQRSSAHYFQRPDADHVELDPTRTALAGWTGHASIARRKGAWRWSSGLSAESPGFEINDAGLLQSADDIAATADLRYFDNTPRGPFNQWDLGTYVVDEWSFGGVRDPALAGVSGAITWSNLWRTTGYVDIITPGLNDKLTRGGPVVGIDWGWQAGITQGNGHGGRHSWDATALYFENDTGSTGVHLGASVTLQPLDRLAFTVAPRVLRFDDHRQFVASLPGGADATFGTRYLFANVERSELAIQTRAQVVFTPTLSLELYAEPFASTGQFTGFGELPAPEREDLRVYGTDGTTIARTDDGYLVTDGGDSFEFPDPDFSVLSFRSTAVLRWEFLPGSTAFVVWQQDRGERSPLGDRAVLGDLGRALGAAGQHTLALKVAYWWSAY